MIGGITFSRIMYIYIFIHINGVMPTHFILLDIIRLIIRTNDAIILHCLGHDYCSAL